MMIRVDEAERLIAALQTAVDQAKAAGQVTLPDGALAGALDAQLGAALVRLQATIDGSQSSLSDEKAG